MLSGKEQPSPSHACTTEGLPKTEPDGRQGANPEPAQDTLHDMVKSARAEHSEGSHEHTLIEDRTFELGQPSTPPLELEQRPFLHTFESEEDHHDVSIGNLERDSKDTPQDACSGDVLHGRPEAILDMENPGSHNLPPSSQPITPSLPLHLIPLLPQVSGSPKRQRRSLGLSSNHVDQAADDFIGSSANATGGTTPSPQSLRSRLQNFSAEPAGISRTLAYAMDQMNITPQRGAELEELSMTREAEVDYGGDEAIRPKTVRFEESTSQLADSELAEHLWTDAVQAAVTARMREESEQKMERASQGGRPDDGVSCRQGATVGGENTAGGMPEVSLRYCLYRLSLFKTLEEAEGRPSKDANAWCTNGGGSGTVESEVEASESGSETEGATLASHPQTVKAAQLQEYTRLKEQEVELRRAEVEVRILEERLEAREKDLKMRLATVRQRLEAVRQRKASINCREEIIRQKLEAITKETQEPANALGADATPESN
jgi:hypothetical protein